MSGSPKNLPKVACVEDLDDQTGKTVNKRSARKDEAKKDGASIQRRHSRRDTDHPQGDSRRAKANILSSSEPPAKQWEWKQEPREDRRMSGARAASPRRSSSRPPLAHHRNVTFQPTQLPISSAQPLLIQQPQFRFVAQHPVRPSSYHEGMPYGSYPSPPSNSAYFGAYGFLPSYPPPNQAGASVGGGGYSYGAGYHPNAISAQPLGEYRQDHFAPATQASTRTLAERLGGREGRRGSVYSNPGCDDRGYESTHERTQLPARKSSLRKTQKKELDAKLMPPPATLRPRRVRYEDDESADSDFSKAQSPDRQRRPSHTRHSQSNAYGDNSEASIEPARSGDQRPRRNSYNTPRAPSAPPPNYEHKYQAAENYQTSIGGQTNNLTAESLKKASQRAHPSSSRSTRSSGSRDESERLRSSVTTTTTDVGAESVTIKLIEGHARVKFGGAEISFEKGSELKFQRPSPIDAGGSQRSSDFGTSEDRRDRKERLSDYSRFTSNTRGSRERYCLGMENRI